MNVIRNIDEQLQKAYASAPHLPPNGRKWLARNVWWITLVGVIIGALGVLSLVLVSLLGGLFLGVAVFLFSAQVGGFILLLTMLGVAVTITTVVIAGMAIVPLKAQQKKGGTLLLVAILLVSLLAIVADIISGDMVKIIKELLEAVISLYFLYEIRDYFQGRAVAGDVKPVPEFTPPTQKV